LYFGLFTFAALTSADINIFRANLSVDSETQAVLNEFAPFKVADMGIFAKCLYDSNWLRTLSNLDQDQECKNYVKKINRCISKKNCSKNLDFFVDNVQGMIDMSNEVFNDQAAAVLAELGGPVGINEEEQAKLDALEKSAQAKNVCKIKVCDREAEQIQICVNHCNDVLDGCEKCLGECPNTMWKLKKKYNCVDELSCENLKDFDYGQAMGEYYRLLKEYEES